MTARPLPPTGRALLDALAANGGALPYRDPLVTTPGLTALRHRGLAMIMHANGPWVLLTVAGRAALGGES